MQKNIYIFKNVLKQAKSKKKKKNAQKKQCIKNVKSIQKYKQNKYAKVHKSMPGYEKLINSTKQGFKIFRSMQGYANN